MTVRDNILAHADEIATRRRQDAAERLVEAAKALAVAAIDAARDEPPQDLSARLVSRHEALVEALDGLLQVM